MSDESGPCLFCDTGKLKIVRSTSLVFAIADGFPVTKGHSLIIPKRHVSEYFDLTPEEMQACHNLLKDLRAKILSEDSSVEGFNIGINCGETAGQTIFHCHIHLIPRCKGDIPAPRGGVRNIIPEKGNY